LEDRIATRVLPRPRPSRSPSGRIEGDVPRALSRLSRRLASSPVAFELELPDGRQHAFGAGVPSFRIRARTERALPALGSLDLARIADAYLDAEFDVEGDMIAMYDLRPWLSDFHPLHSLWRFVQPLVYGQVGTNARAIRSHYDLGADFYLSFMGDARCYTQGVFEHPHEPLEAAQRRKFDFCLKQCDLGPGSHVLEVGPGWGAFAEHAARRGVRVTGVTNSRDSARYMTALGARLGLAWEIVEADLLAYRPSQRFDAVVLMGIMEHLPDYPAVLDRFQALLRPGGRVYLDASASRAKYRASSFITRRIYPGNHSFFVLHDFLAAVARTPLRVRGVYDDRVDYYRTFVHWARNLEAGRERLIGGFGEWDYRRFHLYLWGSAHCFLRDTLQCYRVVLERPEEPAAAQ
jgi:cyclopropane-fatty-acyl-phospholipid synthase